jgi:hypothetical protein
VKVQLVLSEITFLSFYSKEETVNIASFESRIKHLEQEEILSGAISSLNKLLVDKGIVKETEIQDYFLHWLSEQKLTKKLDRRKKTR